MIPVDGKDRLHTLLYSFYIKKSEINKTKKGIKLQNRTYKTWVLSTEI
jgi:hypothetical protein